MEMTNEELEQMREKLRQKLNQELEEYRRRGEWKEYIDLSLCMWECMPDAFLHFDEVPDNLKYQYAIDAYMHHGDSVPEVREAVKRARKYGAPKLPPELEKQEVITIYRAGEEPIDEAPARISWTTSIDTALFFLDKYVKRHARYLYQGKIRAADIIAYTDERNEKEIMQFQSVFDITVIRLSREQILEELTFSVEPTTEIGELALGEAIELLCKEGKA